MKTTRPPAPKSPEPKRSLSAYNLFYRYKRAKILELSGPGGPGGFAAEPSRRAIDATLAAVLGLEDYPSIAAASPLNDEAVQYLRRCEIKAVLGRHPRPSSVDARSRRCGPVGFLEMNKRTVAAWRDVDAFAREVLEDLAAEGERRHKARPSGLRERTRIPRAKAGKGEEPKAKATRKRKKGPEEVDEDATKAEEGAQKEPARPKRPLTAYNLFYRFKRDKILEAHKRGLHSKAAIEDLIATVAGLEGHPHVYPDLSSKPVKDLRSSAIRAAMADNLVPKDVTRRVHRKSHGAMSFLEMGRLMSASWNATDDFGREVFTELAEEGRAIYQEKVQAYEREAGEAKARAPRDRAASKEKSPKPPKKAAKKAGKKAAKKPSARKARAAKPKKKASTLTPKFKAKSPPVEELVFSLDDTSIVTPLADDPAVVTPLGAIKPIARYPALEDHQWHPPPLQVAPSAHSPSYPYAYPSGYDVSPTEVQAPFYPEPMPLFPDIFDMDEEDAHMLAHCVSEVGSDELDSLEAAAAELPEASVEGIAANASFDDFMKLVAALD